MRVGLATCSALADGFPDDHLLADALLAAGASVRFAVWAVEPCLYLATSPAAPALLAEAILDPR